MWTYTYMDNHQVLRAANDSVYPRNIFILQYHPWTFSPSRIPDPLPRRDSSRVSKPHTQVDSLIHTYALSPDAIYANRQYFCGI